MPSINEREVARRSKKEKNRAAMHRFVDRLFDRVEHRTLTCGVIWEVYFSEGGIKGSRIRFEHNSFLNTDLFGEDEDLFTGI